MSGIRTVLTGREIRLMHDAVLMRFRGLASAQAPGFLKERINGLLGGVKLKLDCSTATGCGGFPDGRRTALSACPGASFL